MPADLSRPWLKNTLLPYQAHILLLEGLLPESLHDS